MRTRKQTTYNIDSEQFKYLEREDNIHLHRVDINELNKRLNATKKANFYTTTLIVVFFLSCLSIISFIAVKF
jgi:hypothetical protein